MLRNQWNSWSLLILVLILSVLPMAAQQASLVEGFKAPPDIARPRVYWYWMNGNITKEGITRDVEWFYRAGIRGMETFDIGGYAGKGGSEVVKPPLRYMHPEWKEAFHHALQEADKRSMEITIGAAPGWSQAGGPWVKPEDAMKKLVWTETAVAGGKPFTGALPRPPEVNGPFLDQVRPPRAGVTLPTFYKDQMIIAFRLPAEQKALEQSHPTVTSSGGSFTWADLGSRTFADAPELPAEAGRSSWIQVAFDTPQTVRGVTVAAPGGGARGGGGRMPGAPLQWLEVSSDGRTFAKVIDLPGGNIYQRTFAFAAVTGRYFRYRLPALSSAPFRVARFRLHAATPVNRWQEKAAFAMVPDFYAIDTVGDAAGAIRKEDVVDLTGRMRADGTLDWTPPAGDWVVLRMGYSLTGATNAPAPPEATGFEVDKLSKTATTNFLNEYMKSYEEASRGLMGKHGVNNVATDSWEAGPQNWTDSLLAEFRQRRGYDPTPWVPALTGRVVVSPSATDKFLWDFRRTIADLVIAANFEGIRDAVHARGMKYVTEAMATGRQLPADTMEMKARADYPEGEFWLPFGNQLTTNYIADLRDTASVAHIYPNKLATAESITSTGIYESYGPWDMKLTADQIFLGGINQMTLHVSVLQPDERAPGLSLGPYGQWFTRHQTWAEQMRAFSDYLSRSSYLLQRGLAVIDVAYFYGEDAVTTTIHEGRALEIADGYAYDFVNKESLLNEFSASGGKLATRTGMTYRLLYLGGSSRRMTLPVLEKLQSLAAAGAVVVGFPPEDTPSLSDDPARWKAAVQALWPDASPVRELGKGKIYRTANLSYVLGAEGIAPDFSYLKPYSDASVKYYHRVEGSTDLYFVSNRVDAPAPIQASFRVTGKAAEIWYPDRGTIVPASYRIHDGVTTVPLTLERRDAVFVVFRETTTVLSRTVPAPGRIRLAALEGPWEVAFQAGRGAPPSATFAELSDWSDHPLPGIRYFSGEATYTKTVDIPVSALGQGSRIELDLGTVHEVAEVAVNGRNAGIAWKPPYRVDITDGVKAGANTLSIKVVNLWPNRLIGDMQPGAEKVAFAPNSTYTAGSPLLPSGLIGPVVLEQLVEIK